MFDGKPMTAKGQLCKAKARRQYHHRQTHKYEKQRERTARNKIMHGLLNAAHYDKKYLADFYDGHGGKKKTIFLATNAITLKEYISNLEAGYEAPKMLGLR